MFEPSMSRYFPASLIAAFLLTRNGREGCGNRLEMNMFSATLCEAKNKSS